MSCGAARQPVSFALHQLQGKKYRLAFKSLSSNRTASDLQLSGASHPRTPTAVGLEAPRWQPHPHLKAPVQSLTSFHRSKGQLKKAPNPVGATQPSSTFSWSRFWESSLQTGQRTWRASVLGGRFQCFLRASHLWVHLAPFTAACFTWLKRHRMNFLESH